MRKLVFLFISIFSLVAIELGTTSGSTKLDKPIMVMDTLTIKTVREYADKLDTLHWKTAKASYYDSNDPSQTKEDCDGIGAFGRRIKSGSVALGSPLTEKFIRKNLVVFIKIKDCEVVTPYGKGIFRVDDAMAHRFSHKKNKFFIDFSHEDVNQKYKRLGRFKVKFRIYKIIKPDGEEISPSGFLLIGVQPLAPNNPYFIINIFFETSILLAVQPLEKLSTI